MKKFTFALMASLVFSFSLKAQQFVSTEPSNRNVILEEFTGRTCGWCPAGHVIANTINANNPGRFWSVNIHSNGYFSLNTYPNLNTVKGNQIRAAFGAESFPSGVVNRSTAAAVGRGEWTNQSNMQFNQPAECNVAGMAVINPYTRVATISVEVYYTDNSSADQNYLTVVMLQDSIFGSQSSGSDNPEQWVGGQYCHMHIFRDAVTDVMGEAISPTTQGTLVTRTYQYEIPESIGDPNGVEVDLNNIHFLAWVSEKYQGTPTRPILNANELETVFGVDEPIHPVVNNVRLVNLYDCTQDKIAEIKMMNVGTDPISSMAVSLEYGGETYSLDWEGDLQPYSFEKVTIPVTAPFGVNDMTVMITAANGQAYDHVSTLPINCLEWADLEIEGESELLKLELMQDKFGDQITWEFTSSNGTVLASGGPYDLLIGGTATQPHIERISVPVNECVKFTIRDSGKNGICCTYGQGYYIVKDSHNNVLFGDHNDGDFGEEVSHLISIKGGQASEVEVGATEVLNMTYHEADFVAPLTYVDYPEEVGFSYRKVTNSNVMTVEGHLNEFSRIFAHVDGLDANSIYMVKAYAIVNGETYYGSETTFQTVLEGVNDFAASLKLYPNPTSSVLNIEGEGINSVEVFNAVGQHVASISIDGDKAQINTESLNAGVYFVRILANDGNMVNRTFTVVR